MSAIKKLSGRTLYIDMDEVKVPEHTFLHEIRNTHKKALRTLDPFKTNRGKPMRYDTPEKLQEAINSYFNSCFGPGYYKGKPILDANGEHVIVQTTPFTISGLARHLGINKTTLLDYDVNAKIGLIPREYADIILDAKLRIQEYAEKRLYDRDGSSGARFVLEAGFGWITEKDRKDLKQNKKRIKIAQEKLKLDQEAARAQTLEERQFTVNIVRAGENIDD